MSVAFENLTRRFGRHIALDGLSLQVTPKSFTVFTGPPKSGKSVLFRSLVGLDEPDGGRILLDGNDITRAAPSRRRLGYVPQSFALYPHMSVFDNIAYPMTLARAPRDRIRARVDRAAGMLSITHLLAKTPDQLSGGEKQRTAVARGLLAEADVFVLDDPLVGLDYKLRERLMDDLKMLRKELDATFIYGTADSVEALTLASEIVVLKDGRVVQAGRTEDVYLCPGHADAMELVGFPRANLIAGEIRDGMLSTGAFSMPTALSGRRSVTVGIRPEAVRLCDEPAADAFPATVRLVEDLGGEIVVYVAAGETMLTSAFAAGDAPVPRQGADIFVAVVAARIAVFDGDDGRIVAAGLNGAGLAG